MAEPIPTPRYINFQHAASKLQDSNIVPDDFFTQVPTVGARRQFESGNGGSCALAVRNTSTFIRTSLEGPPIPVNGYEIIVVNGEYSDKCYFYIKNPSATASVNRACAVQCLKDLSRNETIFMIDLNAVPPSPPA